MEHVGFRSRVTREGDVHVNYWNTWFGVGTVRKVGRGWVSSEGHFYDRRKRAVEALERSHRLNLARIAAGGEP